jgi:hypothetical protein
MPVSVANSNHRRALRTSCPNPRTKTLQSLFRAAARSLHPGIRTVFHIDDGTIVIASAVPTLLGLGS